MVPVQFVAQFQHPLLADVESVVVEIKRLDAIEADARLQFVHHVLRVAGAVGVATIHHLRPGTEIAGERAAAAGVHLQTGRGNAAHVVVILCHGQELPGRPRQAVQRDQRPPVIGLGRAVRQAVDQSRDPSRGSIEFLRQFEQRKFIFAFKHIVHEGMRLQKGGIKHEMVRTTKSQPRAGKLLLDHFGLPQIGFDGGGGNLMHHQVGRKGRHPGKISFLVHLFRDGVNQQHLEAVLLEQRRGVSQVKRKGQVRRYGQLEMRPAATGPDTLVARLAPGGVSQKNPWGRDAEARPGLLAGLIC